MIFGLSRLSVLRSISTLDRTTFLIGAIGLIGTVVYGNFIVSRPWCFPADDKAEFSQVAISKDVGVRDVSGDVKSSSFIPQFINNSTVRCNVREYGVELGSGSDGYAGCGQPIHFSGRGFGSTKIVLPSPKAKTELISSVHYCCLTAVFYYGNKVRIYDRSRLVQNIITTQIVDGDEGAHLLDFGVSRDGESADADKDQKYGSERNVGVRIFQATEKLLPTCSSSSAVRLWSGVASELADEEIAGASLLLSAFGLVVLL
jgi:hypothetical protein